jgi:hypothetical protein
MVRLANGSFLSTFPLVFAGEKPPTAPDGRSLIDIKLPMSLVVFRSDDGGFTWDFLSVAVNYTQVSGGDARVGADRRGRGRVGVVR